MVTDYKLTKKPRELQGEKGRPIRMRKLSANQPRLFYSNFEKEKKRSGHQWQPVRRTNLSSKMWNSPGPHPQRTGRSHLILNIIPRRSRSWSPFSATRRWGGLHGWFALEALQERFHLNHSSLILALALALQQPLPLSNKPHPLLPPSRLCSLPPLQPIHHD